MADSITIQNNNIMPLVDDLRQIINQTRSRVAINVNAELTLMYWHIGERINREVLGNARAEYGKQIVATVSRQLQSEYGNKGFEPRTIRRMMQFASLFPDIQIVTPLVTQLSWTHFLLVMPIKDPLAREFYLTMAANERWSKRTLEAKIDDMLYERTAIATKPNELIKQELTELRDNNVLTPDLVFKSPYFLEFTGLKGMYSEKSLEDSLVAHLEQFILELGNGFTFVERQKRMIIDDEYYFADLVFYNRLLQCYVLIDLKADKLTHQDLGQMQMYVNYYDRFVKQDYEKPTIGILLCESKKEALVELTLPKDSNIYATQYQLYLPDKDLLQAKVREWIAEFKETNGDTE